MNRVTKQAAALVLLAQSTGRQTETNGEPGINLKRRRDWRSRMISIIRKPQNWAQKLSNPPKFHRVRLLWRFLSWRQPKFECCYCCIIINCCKCL